MSENGEADQQAERNTLGEFIENNHRLLSAVGLFTALTIFATNLEIEILGAFLSFLLLSATVILWMELLEKFPASAPATAKLTWFESTLSGAMLVVVFYWLLQFRGFWRSLLAIPIVLVLVGIFSGVLKRFDAFNRAFSAKPGQKRGWRYFVAFIVYSAAMLGAILIAAQITESSVGPWLDNVRQLLDEMPLAPTSSPTP